MSQQVQPCADLKRFTSLECAVGSSVFNCPRGSPTFMCELEEPWEGLGQHHTRRPALIAAREDQSGPRVSAFACKVRRYAMTPPFQLGVLFTQAPYMWLSGYVRSEGRADALLSLWNGPICLCQAVNGLFFLTRPPASPGFRRLGGGGGNEAWSMPQPFRKLTSSMCLIGGGATPAPGAIPVD